MSVAPTSIQAGIIFKNRYGACDKIERGRTRSINSRFARPVGIIRLD